MVYDGTYICCWVLGQRSLLLGAMRHYLAFDLRRPLCVSLVMFRNSTLKTTYLDMNLNIIAHTELFSMRSIRVEG